MNKSQPVVYVTFRNQILSISYRVWFYTDDIYELTSLKKKIYELSLSIITWTTLN